MLVPTSERAHPKHTPPGRHVRDVIKPLNRLKRGSASSLRRGMSTCDPSRPRRCYPLLRRINALCRGSRPPRGGRGLKQHLHLALTLIARRRPPRGGRGLKPERLPDWHYRGASPPARGARIETTAIEQHDHRPAASPPARGARIETSSLEPSRWPPGGRPPRGGRGLKHNELDQIAEQYKVAPRAGGAD